MAWPRVVTGGGGGGSSTPADGSVTDAKVAANAAIAASKIAGTAVTQADTGTVTSAMIADGTIVTGDLSATAGITSGQLAGSIAPSKVTGTAITAADTGTVTSAMLAGGITGSKVSANTLTESLLNLGTITMNQLGFLAWNGDPAMTSTGSVLVTGVLSLAKVWVPVTVTPTKANIVVSTVGASLTTITTATVSGAQTAPGSGSWTLTTSSMSGYAAAGIATIGTEIVAYSAWSGTSMTVKAGGYTPGAVYANGATISANTNSIALFDSSGNFLAAGVEQSTPFTSTGQKQVTLIPTPAAITGGYNTYVYVAVTSTGTTPAALKGYSSTLTATNAGPNGNLATTALRWGTQGTSTTGQQSAVTTASITITSANAFWAALS